MPRHVSASRGPQRGRSLPRWRRRRVLPKGSYGSWSYETPKQEILHVYLHESQVSVLTEGQGKANLDGLNDRLKADDPTLEAMMRALNDALDSFDQSRLYIDAMTFAVAAHVLRNYSGGATSPSCKGGLAPRVLSRVQEFLLANIANDVALAEIASLAGCSTTHLSRAFKQSTGLSPFHWLSAYRVERAKTLLDESRLSLAEIALMVGFSAQPQFTTAFSRATGVTPGTWRRERRG